MLTRILIALLALALAAAGGAWGYATWSQVSAAAPAPVATKPAEPSDGVRFEYAYVAPKNPALMGPYERARNQDLLRKLPEIQAIDGMFLLPRPLRYVTAECQSIDAFYSPATGEVVLCYETMQVLLNQAETVAEASKLGPEFPQQYLMANLRFIMLHETGHALIDMFDLPITGREEDAVDQLATTLMQKFSSVEETPHQVSENLRMAGNWLLARAQGQYHIDAYADEHALGEQRYFNLQCLIYGSNPARFLGIVTDGDLPEARARRCPQEWERVNRSWLRLLLAHAAPKYRMTEEQAKEYFEQKEKARLQHAPAPYLSAGAAPTSPPREEPEAAQADAPESLSVPGSEAAAVPGDNSTP